MGAKWIVTYCIFNAGRALPFHLLPVTRPPFGFSANPYLVTFQEHLFHGRYTDYFNEEAIELGASAQVDLAPRGYRVFIQ